MNRRRLMFGAFSAVAAPPAERKVPEPVIVAALGEGIATLRWAVPWLPNHRREAFFLEGFDAIYARVARRYDVSMDDVVFLAGKHLFPEFPPDPPAGGDGKP
jgi:hypothetical protein